MAVSLSAPLLHGPALPSSTGPTYLSGSERSLRVTAQGTLGASVTASANASSIADAAGLSTCERALAQVKSPRAPFDACGSDFGIQYAHEDHFKAEMRGFPTSHLRASSDAVEGSRGRREASTFAREVRAYCRRSRFRSRLPPYPTVSYRSFEAPRFDLRSDWTAGTAALEFRELASSAMQIARYFTLLLAANIAAKKRQWQHRFPSA